MTDQATNNTVAGWDTPWVNYPLEWQPNPMVPVLYANQIEIRVGYVDFVLRLGTTIGLENDKTIVREDARLAMSPQMAKILSIVLPKYIDSYERVNGTIPTPANIEPSTD